MPLVDAKVDNRSRDDGLSEPDARDAMLFYDGDCPFCSAYVRYIRVREAVGELTIINMRKEDAPLESIIERGFDLDEGMVLKLGDSYYHGDDCIHMLALLSSPSGVFNKINALVFSSRKRSRILYPVLRSGRNLTLMLLGRRKIRRSPT